MWLLLPLFFHLSFSLMHGSLIDWFYLYLRLCRMFSRLSKSHLLCKIGFLFYSLLKSPKLPPLGCFSMSGNFEKNQGILDFFWGRAYVLKHWVKWSLKFNKHLVFIFLLGKLNPEFPPVGTTLLQSFLKSFFNTFNFQKGSSCTFHCKYTILHAAGPCSLSSASERVTDISYEESPCLCWAARSVLPAISEGFV